MQPTSLERAINIIGGQSALADEVGVSKAAVNQWVSKGRPPPERCLAIEAATKGEVSRYELRPDIYGKPERRQAARVG